MKIKRILLSLAVLGALCVSAYGQNKKEDTTTSVLVAYFSATGTTARAAERIAEETGGTLYAITPEKPYTAADLDWTDKQSRCYVEMHDAKSRPAIEGKAESLEKYDVVYIGYPIWWEWHRPSSTPSLRDTTCVANGSYLSPRPEGAASKRAWKPCVRLTPA